MTGKPLVMPVCNPDIRSLFYFPEVGLGKVGAYLDSVRSTATGSYPSCSRNPLVCADRKPLTLGHGDLTIPTFRKHVFVERASCIRNDQAPVIARSFIAFIGTRTRRPTRTRGIVPSFTCFLIVDSLTPSKNAACLRLTARGSGSFQSIFTGAEAAATTTGDITGAWTRSSISCGLISSWVDRSNSLRNRVTNLSNETPRSPALNLIPTLNIAAPLRFRFERDF